MARVRYSIKLFSDTEADLVCDSCQRVERMPRKRLKEWLAAGGASRDKCPACGAPYVDMTPNPPVEALNNEFVKFGATINEVLKHRGSVEDSALDANIGFILLNKEEQHGLSSFSRSERYVYAVQGMSREVNNGGFEQFFSNSSGRLAVDLVPALEAMGSKRNLSIAKRAVERLGGPAAESNPWEDLDKEFYENPEDIEKMILDYIEGNRAQFAP